MALQLALAGEARMVFVLGLRQRKSCVQLFPGPCGQRVGGPLVFALRSRSRMNAASAFDLTGRSAIVTGGAMGIGFGIVRRFLAAGAHVLLADRDEAAATAAAKRLDAAPGRLATIACDVGDEQAGQNMVDRCVQAFGGVDILVNNAGIFPQVPVLKMDMALFDEVIRTNLRGLVSASKAAGLQMVKQGRGGRIVNIGSIDSLHPSMVGLAAYDASKGGVLMFTRSFALEMAPAGVHVNLIAPGGIETEGASKPLRGSGLTEAQAEEVRRKFIATKIPLGRMGVPDDIAKVAQFLASPASDYITGAAIVVDGGTLLA
jgi:2-dehydro-3-deoxy-D-gluconate 5-dehydrogenase